MTDISDQSHHHVVQEDTKEDFVHWVPKKIPTALKLIPVEILIDKLVYGTETKAACSYCHEHFNILTKQTSSIHYYHSRLNKPLTLVFCSPKCMRLPRDYVCCYRCGKSVDIAGALCRIPGMDKSQQKTQRLKAQLELMGNWYNVYLNKYDVCVIRIMCSAHCKKIQHDMDKSTSNVKIKARCYQCRTLRDSMPICGCEKVHFCDKSCQKLAWSKHKLDCTWILTQSSSEPVESIVPSTTTSILDQTVSPKQKPTDALSNSGWNLSGVDYGEFSNIGLPD